MRILSLLLLISLPAFAAPDYDSTCRGISGAGFYAIHSPHWPCDNSLSTFTHRNIISLSTLWGGTFGYDVSCLRRYAEDPRFKCFEGHLMNEVGQRNGRLQPYEFLYPLSVSQYKAKLNSHDAAFLRKIKDYATDYYIRVISILPPYTACAVSNSIESNLSTSEAKIVFDILRPIFTPRCSLVWNPNGSGKIAGTIYEKHGRYPSVSPKCITNTDGLDISFVGRSSKAPDYIHERDLSSYEKKYSSCSVQLWVGEFNAIDYTHSWAPPRSRTNYPSRNLFKLLQPYIGKIKRIFN